MFGSLPNMSTQWAAVATTLGEIRVPVQKTLPLPYRRATTASSVPSGDSGAMSSCRELLLSGPGSGPARHPPRISRATVDLAIIEPSCHSYRRPPSLQLLSLGCRQLAHRRLSDGVE